MSALLKELREKRTKAVMDARSIVDQAGKEKRELTEAETRSIDAAIEESDRVKRQIDDEERKESRRAKLDAAAAELETSRGRQTDPPVIGRIGSEGETDRRHVETEDFSFTIKRRGMRPQEIRFKAGTPGHRRHSEAYRAGYRSYLAGVEERNLQSDLDTAGGYIMAPEQFVSELIASVDDEVFIRQYARKFTTDAQSLGVPTRTAKLASVAWGQELTSPTDDTALKFGKRAVTPHYMTGSIKVSRDLLRSSVMNAEEIVNDEITRDASELEEQAFISGHGAGRPLGLFTASADGVSTGRDVSTGNTTTAMTFDGLINAKMALKQKYRAAAMWMFHRDAVKQIMTLKDSYGQYLWQPSTVIGQPERILNLPYIESEWVPNTFTTGLYVGLLGDFKYYWIVDSLMMEIQRLVETSARTNQVEFVYRRKVDGAPILEEAFARVKLA